jgi:hypothetical protein
VCTLPHKNENLYFKSIVAKIHLRQAAENPGWLSLQELVTVQRRLGVPLERDLLLLRDAGL